MDERGGDANPQSVFVAFFGVGCPEAITTKMRPISVAAVEPMSV